jgi:glucosyl-3-phosphoglycerate synthase
MNKSWIQTNTFHHSDFKDIGRLMAAKRHKNLTISLCLPTLNEERTIAKEIVIMKSELMTRYPLLDEIVVIDSGSTDRTREIARSYDVPVFQADDILPQLEKHKGKGENLWKALYVTEGDIIIYIDADIKNIHHRFAYGLLGPLLISDHIRFAKAFYDRPIAVGKNKWRPTGGGRVTELVTRPLFSMFMPDMTQFIQPLSGEYAGYREIFEKIPFRIGYGVETGMLIDIHEKWGLDVMAQVDLDRRVHKNQSTKALGRMAFVILRTFLNRLQQLGRVDVKQKLFGEMIQYRLEEDQLKPEMVDLEPHERPPMVEIPEYLEKFSALKGERSSH